MKVGELFDNKYKIIRILGKGGMGTVYLAENIKLKTFWAIKEVRKDAEEKIDLLAEPNMLKKLNHHTLPRIFDIVEDENSIYIVEDYIEGQSLDKQLKDEKMFEEKRVINWTKQICEAFKYLHENKPNPIIYRDMKPGNLMVDDDDNLKIIDFGIAREYKEESESDTTYMGTRGYAAPEQYGTSQTDGRTDIYSLGVTIYHLLTGKSPNEPPFEILPIRKIDKKLSVGMEYIVKKCTQKDPDKRYKDVNYLIKDLENIHKFGRAYKKKKVFGIIKTMVFFLMLSGFSYLTYSGVMQLDVEKNERYESNVNQGMNLVKEGVFEVAERFLDDAIDEMPDRAEAYKEKVNLYYRMGEYDTCLDYAENLDVDGIHLLESHSVNYILGTIHFDREEFEIAQGYFKKAVELSPYTVEYERDLAVNYAKMKELEKAKEVLKFIDDNKLSEEVSFYVSGEIFIASNSYEKAAQSLKNSIRVSKDNVIRRKSYVSLGEILLGYHGSEMNEPDEAIKLLENALLELNDKNDLLIIEMLAKGYYNRALGEDDSIEDLKKSADNFKRLLDLGYKRAYIYRNIYTIYFGMEEFSVAEEILNEMIERYPEDYTCYKLFSILYAEIENRKPNENRDYRRTLEYYEKAVEYAPDKENTQDLFQLRKMIEELRAGNWI